MGINQITLEQVFSYGRDLAVGGTVIMFGWKVRGAWDVISKFLTRIEQHMDEVEHGMQLLLDNHLTHIKGTLDRIADAEVSANKHER